MKKLLLLLVFAGLVSSLYAQEYGYDDISNSMDKFGVKLGVNFANLNSNPDDANYEMATKFPSIGLVSEMNISKMFKLQGELGYSLLGSYYKSFSLPISLGYINLAALMKVYPFDDMGVNAFLGLQYGYLVYAAHDDLDRLDQYKTSDFDLLVGLGYTFDMGLFIDFRYLLGFTNISNLQDIHYSNSIKNSAIQVQIGWLF